MKFKLNKDEEIIFEPMLNIKTKIFIFIMYFGLVSCISMILICISLETVIEWLITLISIFTAYFISQIVSLKIVLTNKRLLYRDLLLIPHSIDLNNIISIEVYSNFINIYFDPSLLGISVFRIKIHNKFFKIIISVQDGNKLQAKILNYIDANLKNKKLNQASLYKKNKGISHVSK